MVTTTAQGHGARLALVISLIAVAATVAATFAVIGIHFLTSTEPQPAVYVAGTPENPVFGYRQCQSERVLRLTVSAVSGNHTQDLRVVAAGSGSADESRFDYGHAPVGYQTELGPLPLPAQGRLTFAFDLSNGLTDGLQIAPDDIHPGQIYWAGGYLNAGDLSSVDPHEFGCWPS